MSPSGRITHVIGYIGYIEYIGLLGTGFMQVFYLGRAPRTKETLPDFLKWRRVTRYPLVFRGLTESQRTPRIWGVTENINHTFYYVSWTIILHAYNLQNKHLVQCQYISTHISTFIKQQLPNHVITKSSNNNFNSWPNVIYKIPTKTTHTKTPNRPLNWP